VKRRRGALATHRPSDLVVTADVATDDAANTARRPRGNRYQGMKLPHERDESAYRLGAPNPTTEQGARDLESGKTNTEGYDAAERRVEDQARRG
jgi:hypothetical protein